MDNLGEVQMDNTKVEKVHNWKTPTNVTEVQKFLGFTGYYCYFIKDYLKITRPLLQLTHLTTPWSWQTEEQTAFETLRKAMIDKPVVHQPDFTKPFFLLTDTSAYGMGAILSQEGGSSNPNSTLSHTTLPHSQKQNATTTSTNKNS
jgi:RNase H-like domain found in reverse transcriptase